MINIPSNFPDFKPLTPQRAKEYLQKKPQYLAIWNQLVPNYFNAERFCEVINKIRIKRLTDKEELKKKIEELGVKKGNAIDDKQRQIIDTQIKGYKKKEKTLYSDILYEIFNNDIAPAIKNTHIGYKEVNQLIGSLSNISKTKKEEIQEITEMVNEEVHENLEMERYEEEILMSMDELIDEFFTSKGTGNITSEGERKDFGQQAWTIFLQNHKADIEAGKIDVQKLNLHLHKKKVI